MTLRLLGHIELPSHRSDGGFDHADVHSSTDRLYVAHTANDSIDVIDCVQDRYVESIPGLTGVAGALVSEARGLIFTTNRGENTVSIFAPGDERNAFKIGVGIRPNGVAFYSKRGLLVVANVGDLAIADSCTASVVDLGRKERVREIKVPGRTRWAIYDPATETFFINIASPARIVAIDARDASKYRKNMWCQPKALMAWTLIRRRTVFSAPATQASCSLLTPGQAAYSAKCRSAAPQTSFFSISGRAAFMSPSGIRAS